MGSELEAHETSCIYVLFGQQAVDTIKQISSAGDATVARVERSIEELKDLKKRTERRLQQLAQLTNTLSIEGHTKKYVVPLKTREHPLNVQDSAFKLCVDTSSITRDIRFSIFGLDSVRFPVAVCTIAFLLLPKEYLEGEHSRIESFILHDSKPVEILKTRLSLDAPSDVPLEFKLVIKLFY
jgi:hypothetical protein